MLWIMGSPGSGKSALLTTIVQNLSTQAQTIPDSPRLSYCFCSANRPGSCSAASALKSPICLLLLEQLSLNLHLTSLRDPTEIEHFDHLSNFLALSGLFYDIARDSDLSKTYLVIGAIDECVKEGSGAHSGFEEFP